MNRWIGTRFVRAVRSLAVALTVLGTTVSPGGAADEPSWLFVQVASSGSYQDGTLSLNGIARTIAFTERPDRQVRHLDNGTFAKYWQPGEGSFASDPPNASLTFEENGATRDVIVELGQFQLTDSNIVYRIKILDGDPPPARFGPASLFIDCIGLIEVCDTN